LDPASGREARRSPPAKCAVQEHRDPPAAPDDLCQGRGEQRRARLRAYEAWVEVSTEAALEIWSSSKSLTSAGNYPTVGNELNVRAYHSGAAGAVTSVAALIPRSPYSRHERHDQHPQHRGDHEHHDFTQDRALKHPVVRH